MIAGCTCAIHGWGRVPTPSCPIHQHRAGRAGRVHLRIQRTQEERTRAMHDEIVAHEELFLGMLREHRETCALCHDRDDLWVTCKLGEVLRGAWFNAFRLLVQPTTWSSVETVRPFQIGGVS